MHAHELEHDWRLALAARMALGPGDLVVRVGEGFGMLDDAIESCVGLAGTVAVVDPRDALDDCLEHDVRPALVTFVAGGHESDALARARRTLLRWRPVVFTVADPEAALNAGATLYEQQRMLRSAGYVVRAVWRFGLRRPDTSIYADACHWIAAPCEHNELLTRISSRILWSQLLPWQAISPQSRAA